MSSIPFARPDLTEREADAVRAVVMSGDLAGGSKVTEFEEKFAAHVGARHAVAVSSCTSGFLIALQASGVRDGTVVQSPTYTFTGPAMMARKLGAWVDLVDNAPGSFVPDKDAYWREYWRAAALPVHFAGESLSDTSLKRVHVVIDDAAHAVGSVRDSSMVGAQGYRATVFSFYATKPLCTGNGGMVTTDDDALAAELRSIRLHGFSRDLRQRYSQPGSSWDYDVERPGWKANMTDMAAAMGIVQLDRLEEMRKRRQWLARIYNNGLRDVPGIQLPYDYDSAVDYLNHAWHLFPILCDRRDELHAHLSGLGIGTSVHFKPLHLHTAWRAFRRGKYPNADDVFARELSLPIYSTMTVEQLDRVVEAVRALCCKV